MVDVSNLHTFVPPEVYCLKLSMIISFHNIPQNVWQKWEMSVLRVMYEEGLCCHHAQKCSTILSLYVWDKAAA